MRATAESPPSSTENSGMPASSAPLAASPRSGAAVTSILQAESSSTYSISSASRRACTGTTVAPMAIAP